MASPIYNNPWHVPVIPFERVGQSPALLWRHMVKSAVAIEGESIGSCQK